MMKKPTKPEPTNEGKPVKPKLSRGRTDSGEPMKDSSIQKDDAQSLAVPKKIALTKGFFTIVDDEDYEQVAKFKWHASCRHTKNRDKPEYKEDKRNYYAMRQRKINGKWSSISLHRFLMNPPKEMEIDHVNGDGLDNRRSNLRIVVSVQNNRNRRAVDNARSKYKGVRKDKNKWHAAITIGLGAFDNEIDAAEAYDKKAKELFGNYAWLNEEHFSEVKKDTNAATRAKILCQECKREEITPKYCMTCTEKFAERFSEQARTQHKPCEQCKLICSEILVKNQNYLKNLEKQAEQNGYERGKKTMVEHIGSEVKQAHASGVKEGILIAQSTKPEDFCSHPEKETRHKVAREIFKKIDDWWYTKYATMCINNEKMELDYKRIKKHYGVK